MGIFMRAAIDEALDGLLEGGIPIGAVLVENGKIIGRGRNRRLSQHYSLFHSNALLPVRRGGGAVGIKKVVVGKGKALLPGISCSHVVQRASKIRDGYRLRILIGKKLASISKFLGLGEGSSASVLRPRALRANPLLHQSSAVC